MLFPGSCACASSFSGRAAADTIDFSSGQWEVLFLINRTNPAAPEFVGYFTLFTFVNPFKGARIRVCQALILPHEQNRGEPTVHVLLGRMTVCSMLHVWWWG
jgi:hypothetical protein